MEWSAGWFVAIFLGGALTGYLTALWRPRQVRRELPTEQLKHRLQLLFDSYANESMDKFVQTLEVSPQTLPLHLAVGRQFRQQGEVDKAILVHQNLLSHPQLSDAESEPIVFELAQDYYKAGLYDRAETLWLELAKSPRHGEHSLRQLLAIYEQEKDWIKAIATAECAPYSKRDELSLRLAHYYCERAEELKAQGDSLSAQHHFHLALKEDARCVRACLALALLHLERQDYAAALVEIERAAIEPALIPLLLPLLSACLEHPASQARASTVLQDWSMRYALPALHAMCWRRAVAADLEPSRIVELEQQLSASVQRQPSAAAFVFLMQETELYQHRCSPNMLKAGLLDYLNLQAREQSRYLCKSCGFTGSQLFWHCPSCHRWQTVKPPPFVLPAVTPQHVNTETR